jgi:pyruvate-formate lyase-activating enzyme
MRITGYIGFTGDEWEGVGACRVMLGGGILTRPLRETRRTELEGAGADEVLERIRGSADMLEGAIVAGGDLGAPGMLALLKGIRAAGLPVRLDVDGMQPGALDDLLGARYAESVCLEIMAPLEDAAYRRVAGDAADADAVRRSIAVIRDSGVDCVFRTVAVPGVIDADGIAGIAGALWPSARYRIVRFDPGRAADPALAGAAASGDNELAALGRSARRFVRDVRIADL